VDIEQPVPCSVDNVDGLALDIILVSHLDLDTVGGVLALMGCKPENDSFWEAAAFTDLNGPHRVVGSAHESQHAALAAYWELNQQVPASTTYVDVTDIFELHEERVVQIANSCRFTLAKGEAHLESLKAQELALEESSFVGMRGRVTLRQSDQFVNGFYHRSDVVLALNPEHGSLTLSFNDDSGNAADLMKAFFGPEAGGHAGIAGTPREKKYTTDDLTDFATFVAASL